MAAAVALALAPAASAGGRDGGWRGDEHGRHERHAPWRNEHGWQGAPRGHGLAAVRVPARIVGHERRLWAPYRISRVVDRHRVHEVYAFPVWVAGRVVLRPYHYRDGRLILAGGRGAAWVGMRSGF
jgi:hypothetical protein